jgi:hypothetical protein
MKHTFLGVASALIMLYSFLAATIVPLGESHLLAPKRPDRVKNGRNMAEKPIFTKNLKGRQYRRFLRKFDFAENGFLGLLWRAEHDFDG